MKGDPRAEASLEVVVQALQPIAHLRGRTERTQRVVLVRDRHPEHGEHGVADELLHRAAVPLDRRAHGVEVAEHQIPY